MLKASLTNSSEVGTPVSKNSWANTDRNALVAPEVVDAEQLFIAENIRAIGISNNQPVFSIRGNDTCYNESSLMANKIVITVGLQGFDEI